MGQVPRFKEKQFTRLDIYDLQTNDLDLFLQLRPFVLDILCVTKSVRDPVVCYLPFSDTSLEPFLFDGTSRVWTSGN